MFWRLDLATCWRLTSVAKNACLAKIGAVFKSFSVFPQTFCDYSSSLSTVSFPNAPCNPFQTPLLLYFFSKSSRKGMGLLFLTSYAMVCVLLSCCLGCYFLSYCVQSFYSLCAGYGGLCLMLISSGIVLLVIMFLFFVLCFGCC